MLAQSSTSDALAAGTIVVLALVAVAVGYVLTAIPLYGIFKKSGEVAWAAFVPIFNWVKLLEAVGRPAWWILLFLIPLVNVVVFIVVMADLATAFGKGFGFVVGLVLLTWIFMLILGFGPAPYLGPGGTGGPRGPVDTSALPPSPAE